jgi:hypothetical protein
MPQVILPLLPGFFAISPPSLSLERSKIFKKDYLPIEVNISINSSSERVGDPD